ncbi:MAG: transposon-encoded TnpW family protein [Clostridia bacterium]|nr:transposon-encoded TnpW family protein [Clostridia bacterium]
MKKVDVLFNPTAVNVIPPEPIDENEPVDLVNYMIPRSKECVFDYGKVRRFGADTFVKKTGGTTYEVSTHFNPDGRQSALEQFKQMILAERLI